MKKISIVFACIIISLTANAQNKFACDGKEIDLTSFQFVEEVEDFFINRIYMKESDKDVQIAHVRNKDGALYSYEIFTLPKAYFASKNKESYLKLTLVDDAVYSADIVIEPEKKVITCSSHSCGDDYWLEDEPWTSITINLKTKEAAMKILDALIKK